MFKSYEKNHMENLKMESRINLKHVIEAFEKQFQCRLCLHDYTGELKLRDLLPSYHLNPFCTGVKLNRKKIERICVAFDCGVVQERLADTRTFLLKKCPCGLIEGVFPVFLNDHLAGCIFAGPFSGSSAIPSAAELLRSTVKASPLRLPKELPPPLPRKLDQFRIYGELLAGFIELMTMENRSSLPLSEKEQIIRLIEKSYDRNIGLSDAAELLSLSPARASDRIRRIFGKGFCALLQEQRLSAARKLLELSCFPVERIARRCGFRDGAYFHRVFRRETSMTPIEYRNLPQTKMA